MSDQTEDRDRQKRIEKNLADFEQILRMNDDFQREKKRVLEEAERLGVDLNMEIPWDHLNKNQKKELERIKLESQRDLELAIEEEKPASKPRRHRGLRI